MSNHLLFVKLNKSSDAVHSAISYVKESLDGKIERFYYTNEKDTHTVYDLMEAGTLKERSDEEQSIVFIIYRKVPEVFISRLYVGSIIHIEHRGSCYQIYYKIEHKIESPLVIDNFMKFSMLNITRDFEEDSHISIEDSAPIKQQLLYATQYPCNLFAEEDYPHLASEDALSEFAQRNEYCSRLFNILPSSDCGEYQRDCDRIIHCKAFRRMVDKAQIFTSSKGDHYRTRMTHTLCVAQIARSIASRIAMNVPLTESIALGHDLGHTPFGHQGERTLDKMAQRTAGIGFKHNFQSLNVASVLEEEYIECSGLDLSIQALEGMWKHTRIRKKPGGPLICNTAEFLPYNTSDTIIYALHPEHDFCSTIEGQIVSIADEIAQRSHDLDDALSAGLFSIDSLLETLSIKKFQKLHDDIIRLKGEMDDARALQHVFVSEQELLISRIASQIIDYFIKDVVDSYERFLRSPDVGALRDSFAASHRVDRQIIRFSTNGQILNDYLEAIVTRQVISSPEVAAFDDKAERIVSKLFELYYNNPRLLHDGTLQRIYIEMRRRSENVIHFQDGDIGLIANEWERIKSPQKAAQLRDLREEFPHTDLSAYASVEEFRDSFAPDSAEYETISEYLAKCKSEYTLKQQVLVRAICDFIAGMTDSYATAEYRKLLC